jgi:hypothetical protein
MAITRCIRFEKTIDRGITDLGNFAFLIKFLSQIIDGVALVSDKEKKSQTKRPINR